MLAQRGRRCWSQRALGDWPESLAKDTRVAAADLDSAAGIAFDNAAAIPFGTAGPPVLAGHNWWARYIWNEKPREIGSVGLTPFPLKARPISRQVTTDLLRSFSFLLSLSLSHVLFTSRAIHLTFILLVILAQSSRVQDYSFLLYFWFYTVIVICVFLAWSQTWEDTFLLLAF